MNNSDNFRTWRPNLLLVLIEEFKFLEQCKKELAKKFEERLKEKIDDAKRATKIRLRILDFLELAPREYLAREFGEEALQNIERAVGTRKRRRHELSNPNDYLGLSYWLPLTELLGTFKGLTGWRREELDKKIEKLWKEKIDSHRKSTEIRLRILEILGSVSREILEKTLRSSLKELECILEK